MSSIINASTTSGLVQTADTSGTIELQSNGTTMQTISSTGSYGQLKSGTAQASTSGTSIDFTSIPSWVKRITVLLSAVSTNGTSVPMIQIGSGSVTSSGYVGTVTSVGTGSGTAASMSAGNYLTAAWTAASAINGSVTIELVGSNTYIIKGIVGFTSGAANAVSASAVTLSGALDRVRITAFNGTDTFDAGSINILYEG